MIMYMILFYPEKIAFGSPTKGNERHFWSPPPYAYPVEDLGPAAPSSYKPTP